MIERPLRDASRVALVSLVALHATVATARADQVTVSSEIQSAWYPRDGATPATTDSDIRGWSSIESQRVLGRGFGVRGDLTLFGSQRRRALVDGEAALTWRGPSIEIAAGLLREQWGRSDNSPLDALGPANTAFSLVGPERRLSQPTIRATASLGGLAVDLYALTGARRQPVPESDGRFGFSLPSRDVAPYGRMGDQSIAVRVSASTHGLDWSAHLFTGRSRRATFVPQVSAAAGLTGVDAVYSDIVQVGGELETTRADWRFLSEGFVRQGDVDVFGRDRTYGQVSAVAEYQRLGAFDGAYNVIPRLEIVADTRGTAVDIPFASSLRAGVRVATTTRLPVQVDTAYLHDWVFHGHGVMASVERAVAESPTLNLGFRVTAFSGSGTPSVLDVWKDDLELYAYVRIEVSK